MIKNFFTIIAFLSVSIGIAQQVSVPYRIGTKFGVATTDGKMILAAEYDIVEPETYNEYSYYVAYKLADNGNLSTLIYKDKIILKDKNYSSYYINNALIKAIEYKVLSKSNRYNDANHSEIEHLYDLKGKKIFEGDYKSISIIDDIDEANKISTLLIYTHNNDDYESLYLFDKKLKKITKTFIENARPIMANFNYTENYQDRSITNNYIDKNGIGKQMILELKDNKIAIKSETNINFKAENNRINDREFGFSDVKVPNEPALPILNSTEEKKIFTVRKIERKLGFYYLPKKIEELKISNFSLKEDEQFIVSKDNKQGLYTVYSKTYSVPVMYDEIIFADFEGRNGGYVLRNGDKYGVFIYSYPIQKIVEPLFDKIPLLVNFNYFGEKKPLFKLYDNDGKLFCYANETGKLFYKN